MCFQQPCRFTASRGWRWYWRYSRWGGRGEITSKLKECDIGRDIILLLVYKIDAIAFLRAQVANKHPFDTTGCWGYDLSGHWNTWSSVKQNFKFRTLKYLKYEIKYSEKIGSNHREHGWLVSKSWLGQT